MKTPRAVLLLALLLFGTGISHFVVPDFYADMVPSALPAPRLLGYLAGVLELAGAVGLLLPHTRVAAAWCVAALFVVVFPANVAMALNADSLSERIGTYARLPVQIPLIWWAVSVARASEARRAAG